MPHQLDDATHRRRAQPHAAEPDDPVRVWQPDRAGAVLALQRAVGNRTVSGLIGAASRAPTVQRCGPGGCGPSGCGGAAHDSLNEEPEQGVFGQEDEFGAPGQLSAPPAVQRDAAFGAGPVNAVNNLANCVVNNQAVGVTWPTLNGTQFWSSAEVRGAIVRPTLKVTALPADPDAAGAKGFDAEVDTVPTNNASFNETVLSAGPWRLDTAKATIGAMLPALTSCSGAGNTRFRAYGDPSDAAMAAANRRHEDHHAADHKAAFEATVVPWDQKLAAAKAGGQKFNGATAADAEAALWAAMGGTPEQIADAFFNACAAAVVAFHATAAGGAVEAPTHPGARSHCAISWAKYHNPS